MTIVMRVLGPDDAGLLTRVAAGVFDHQLEPSLTAEFLDDPRHHLVAALDGEQVVGFVSSVHYVHPDKPAELFVNEIGVAPSHRRLGLGRQLLRAMLDLAGRIGCVNAWVLTDRANTAAMALYAALGGVESSTPPVMFEFRVGPSGAVE